ncbi:sugar ABC transporter substrate-binding protein [Virgisporangium aliadipatigenens]|uniref:Sugar ABC transporter substrate-binding protein n=1 Tax=Virgisporangium aliadipatigenens TaxID=741659 RepID=A0A8J4DTJ7_9ACTN|nr:sugar ABC transporter substrate-binding protein [Virgisporangium aliadipatigenens]GIJ50260.1 sugar ABC transporter substrate-binding protein [Virgisporangium aliadipatigenens]
MAISRRNLLRGAGGVAAAAALAACGSNTGRSGSGKSLSQWYHQYGEAGTQQAAEKFAKAYKDANVTIQWIPGEYDQKLNSSLLTDDGPDVFEGHFNAQMAKSNQVVPLDDIIADVKSDFSEIDIASNTYNGKLYGIRMIDDPQLFIYRKSMLDKAGIKPPTTFDELIAAAKALTTKDVKGLFLGNDDAVDWAANQMLASTGQRFLTPDKKVGFNSDKTVAALIKVKELVDAKVTLTGAPTNWWDPSAFNQGLCAMSRQGMWAIPGIKQAIGDDFGVFPSPAFDGGTQAIYLGGWTTFVSAKSKNVEAAKKFVRWLWIDQTAYQEEWSLNYGFHIPPRKSIAAKATKLQSGQAAETLKFTQQFGWVDDPNWTEAMKTAMKDMCSNVFLKGADPRAELATAVGKVENELKTLVG